MPQGVSLRSNSRGVAIIRLHYSALKGRDAEWVASEKPKMSEAMWAQEQEIDYSAAGGERVLRGTLQRRWNDIVITDPAWQPDPAWSFSNGLDYGKAHPCAFIAGCMDFEGRRYAFAEHYRTGLTPKQHVPLIQSLRMPFADSRPPILQRSGFNYCDPSLGPKNVATEDGFTSYVELFQKAGMPNLQLGMRGQDLKLVSEVLDAWNQPDPMFKIVLRVDGMQNDAASMRMREGTYSDGCPNLLWELLGLRRKDTTAARQETHGEAEGLVDKENDAWDALKYWWMAQQIIPKVSADQQWRERVREIRSKNPDIDLNSLAIIHGKFQRKLQEQEHLSWR